MNYALITGASKGIGKAIATELAARGINLLLVARSEALLETVATDLSTTYAIDVKYLAIDLARQDAATTVYEWCTNNRFDVSILINNAGYGLSGSFDRFSLEENQQMLQVNMITLVSLSLLFIPEMKKHPQAYIMNIASTAAYQAIPWLNLYAASKTFVLQFSRGLSHELKGTSVSVTCICPGPTDTNFVNRAQMGDKAIKMADRVNLSVERVARVAVKAMFNRKTERIIGSMNIVGALMARIFPKMIVEKVAGSMYK